MWNCEHIDHFIFNFILFGTGTSTPQLDLRVTSTDKTLCGTYQSLILTQHLLITITISPRSTFPCQ